MNSIIVPSIFKCMNFITSWIQLQSWTKVLGTVLQHAYFSVISRFPLKTVRHFQNPLALLPSPTLYKVETRKKFWIHMSKIVCGVRGGVGPVCPKTFVHEFYWCCLGGGGGTMDIVLLFCRRVSKPMWVHASWDIVPGSRILTHCLLRFKVKTVEGSYMFLLNDHKHEVKLHTFYLGISWSYLSLIKGILFVTTFQSETNKNAIAAPVVHAAAVGTLHKCDNKSSV